MLNLAERAHIGTGPLCRCGHARVDHVTTTLSLTGSVVSIATLLGDNKGPELAFDGDCQVPGCGCGVTDNGYRPPERGDYMVLRWRESNIEATCPPSTAPLAQALLAAAPKTLGLWGLVWAAGMTPWSVREGLGFLQTNHWVTKHPRMVRGRRLRIPHGPRYLLTTLGESDFHAAEEVSRRIYQVVVEAGASSAR